MKSFGLLLLGFLKLSSGSRKEVSDE